MSINIDIDGEWGLQSDPLQFILGRWTTRIRKKDGEEVEVKVLKDRQYATSLSVLLKFYKKSKVLESECQTLEELKELIKELDSKIQKISQELGV